MTIIGGRNPPRDQLVRIDRIASKEFEPRPAFIRRLLLHDLALMSGCWPGRCDRRAAWPVFSEDFCALVSPQREFF